MSSRCWDSAGLLTSAGVFTGHADVMNLDFLTSTSRVYGSARVQKLLDHKEVQGGSISLPRLADNWVAGAADSML